MVLRTVVAGLFMFSASAFANNNSGGPANDTLDGLKAKCADYLANPQIKPVKVKITCNELSYYWAAGPAKASKLPNLRNVGATVQMKGFQVPHAFFPIQVSDTAIQCQTFVKMERQVHNVDVELACEDLAQVNDLGAFCSPILDQRAAQDPSLIEEHPTSEVVSLCPQS